jgi:hypothetical protein
VSDPKQEESSFKVVDRRLFTEEGEIRKEVVEQEKRDEEIAAKRAESAAREKAQGATTESAPGTAQKGSSLTAASSQTEAFSASAGTLSAAGDDGIAPSRSFQILVDFIARNAAAMLGGMADPRTGQPFLDLEGAHEMIDMLDVLREKTRGNLAKTDDELLVEVIGGLKLTYVEISKAAADAMAKKAVAKK